MLKILCHSSSVVDVVVVVLFSFSVSYHRCQRHRNLYIFFLFSITHYRMWEKPLFLLLLFFFLKFIVLKIHTINFTFYLESWKFTQRPTIPYILVRTHRFHFHFHNAHSPLLTYTFLYILEWIIVSVCCGRISRTCKFVSLNTVHKHISTADMKCIAVAIQSAH